MNTDLTPTACPHPYGCQCAICKPFAMWSTTPVGVDQAAYDLAVARRVRADDRLRSQRKRHAQRLAALEAQLADAQAENKLLKVQAESLKGKIWDLEVLLKHADEPTKTIRAILDKFIRVAQEHVTKETTT